ncbi:MAG: hypothetical protein M3173_01950 [Chloroflexota bacterium]|nr:hypothetical protein [Chloroflexota bacterium]
MSHLPVATVRSLVTIALLLVSLTALMPGGAAAQSDRGLIDETSYQSPQFGYTVTWGEPWQVSDRDVLTNPGGFDTITLRSLDGVVRVSGRADTYDPLTFLQDTIAIQLASGAQVINLDTTSEVPTAELQIGQDRMRLEVVSLPESGAVVLNTLRANELDYEIALENAQANIQVAGAPIFSAGSAVPTGTTPTQEAIAPTEAGIEPTEERAEPTQTAAVPTQAPVEPTSTQEVLGGGVEGSTYTSPNFGFSVSWDPSVWTVPEDAVYSEPDFDTLMLDSGTGPLWITGWRAYEGNPATCLLGEQTYINDPEAGITEWQVAVDASGSELTGEEENRAWGVFTSVYTDPADPNAEPEPYVDYLECVSLSDESVVIFHSYAPRELYNDHIGNVTSVIETLEAPGVAPASPEPVTTEPATIQPTATEPVATEPATVQTAATPSPTAADSTPVDLTTGDTVTGQSYAYSFEIPAGWQVNESSLGDVERTVLGNGTSTVTVEARSMQVPALSECVNTIAEEHEGQAQYGDLALSRTASGEPFTGEDDFSAFANYTFTGPDGEPWAHFIECRWVAEGESVLVVTQDVPEALFGSERAARRQIQNSIQIGP